MSGFKAVAKADEVPEGEMKLVEIDGQPVAIVHTEGEFFAIDNVCQHKGGPLNEGELEGTTLICPWHSWEYDIRTGECEWDDNVTLKRFSVKVENGEILVSSDPIE